MENIESYVEPAMRRMATWGAIPAVDEAVFSFFRDVLKYELRPGNVTTSSLPLVKSPSQLVIAIVAYLIFVLGGMSMIGARQRRSKSSNAKGGTEGRANGAAAPASAAEHASKSGDGPLLVAMVIVHNAFLVALSMYMCVEGLRAALRGGYLRRFVRNPMDASDDAMTRVVYIFYVSKIYEFLDTVIMIVKGNLRQVTFLHCYHHVSISFIWWAIAFNAPGGEAYLSLIMNSWVHVCMYLYYLLSTVIKEPGSRKRYLWWGKYLTQMQMLQFAINLGHGAACIFLSPYPRFYSILITGYMVSLLVLFGQFYLSKYKRGGTAAKKKTS